MTETIRQAVKRIPGARWIYRSFIATPGGWIFTRGNTGWLGAPANLRRLPLLFGAFAIYCRYAPVAGGTVLAAAQVHAIVSALTRWLGLRDEFNIEVNGLEVYVLLTDPRSLVIPGEVSGAEEIALLRELLAPGDTFVDLGANHGSFAINASRVVGSGGLVVAVEPQPKLASLVERSLDVNGLSPFQVFNFACADSEGTAEFFVPKATSGSAGLFREFSASTAMHRFSVDLHRFDDPIAWREFPGRCVVKLDVEGAEMQVLAGAVEAIRLHRPPLMMEINPHSMAAAETSLDDLLSLLQALGYGEYREIADPSRHPLAALELRQRNIVVFAGT